MNKVCVFDLVHKEDNRGYIFRVPIIKSHQIYEQYQIHILYQLTNTKYFKLVKHRELELF